MNDKCFGYQEDTAENSASFLSSSSGESGKFVSNWKGFFTPSLPLVSLLLRIKTWLDRFSHLILKAILPKCGYTHQHLANTPLPTRDKEGEKMVGVGSPMLLLLSRSVCPTLCDPMDRSTPGLPVHPVHHQLPEFTQTHVHWVRDAIQPSHPLSPPSPPVLNLSQHQGLFHWVGSSHQVAKVWELQLQHQAFQWIFRVDFL